MDNITKDQPKGTSEHLANPENTYSVEEAAQTIGVSPAMVVKYAEQGLIENVGEEGRFARRRFRKADIDNFKRPKRGRPFNL